MEDNININDQLVKCRVNCKCACTYITKYHNTENQKLNTNESRKRWVCMHWKFHFPYIQCLIEQLDKTWNKQRNLHNVMDHLATISRDELLQQHDFFMSPYRVSSKTDHVRSHSTDIGTYKILILAKYFYGQKQIK